MFNSQLLKNKIFLSFFLAGFFVLCFPFHANAQVNIPPQISVLDLKVDGISGNQIKGTFNVWNNEKYFLSDLGYEINLIQGTNLTRDTSIGVVKIMEVIDTVVPNDALVVPPGQTINKSFTYQYPKNIVSGDYTLRIRAITGRGSELGWQDQTVSLSGSGNFLQIDYSSPSLLVNGKQNPPLTGANVSATDSVATFFKVKNSGDTVTVTPDVKIYERSFNMPVFKEYRDSSITFAAGETKEVKLQMPKISAPESYLAEIKFYNGSEQVLASQYFRWVVEGTGGKIIYVKADKDYFKAGENLNLTIETTGPAETITKDNISDMWSGTLEITVSDKDGNVVAKASKDVISDSYSLDPSIIAIPIDRDLVSPMIDVKLVANGKILDERIINMPVFSAQAKQISAVQEKAKADKFLIYLVIAGLIIILVAVFLIFKFKTYLFKRR